MILKAKVDTIEGNVVLDTGSPHLVLNVTYFRDYPINTVPDGEQTNITGSTAPLYTTTINSLSFGNLRYYKLEADLVSLGNIENTRGIKILGLLGVELFRQCEMIIDFENNLIYLHRIAKKEAATYKHILLNDTSQYRSFPIEIDDNHIIVSTEMAEKKLKLAVDCAAELNILDSRLPHQVFENFAVAGKVKLTGVGNKQVDALFGNMSNMKLGKEDMGNILVTVTNLERTCFAHSGCVNGVLGFSFLSMHKLGFNFVTRKMYIWK